MLIYRLQLSGTDHEDQAMQYDWNGFRARGVRAPTHVVEPPRYCSNTSGSRVRMMQPSKPTQKASWPRKIVLVLAVFLGGSTLVTTALAAAVGHHEALHAQFCHEVNHLDMMGPFIRGALSFMVADPS
jgi:hypothetical protein